MNRKRTLNPRILAGRAGNWRNRRTVARGRRPLLERAGSRITARIPLYRDRINRATGRPHRDDATTGRVLDQSLASLRDAHAQRLMPASPRDFDCCRTAPAQSADRVLGAGRAARAGEALRQANHDPWAGRETQGRPPR